MTMTPVIKRLGNNDLKLFYFIRVSAGNGKSISQFLSLAIILHSILALFGNGAN